MDEVVKLLHLLADSTRLRLALQLLAADATVSELAARLDLPQPRASTHLGLLRDAGLVVANRAGRQQVYHLDAPRFGPLLADVQALLAANAQRPAATLPRRSAAATRAVVGNAPIRHARTCYDHLAGVAGVQLLDELLARGWLEAPVGPGQARYGVTDAGAAALSARGVEVAAARRARRQLAIACLDWTERRPHLGGALGAAILHALRAAAVVEQAAEGRTVVLRAPLQHWLDGSPP
ncbi:MAG TPA: metalloregulator ArsR/SmtB family transcription factor [Chloroflexota bacterium]|jgi:DNA-binding transcriptional ArsR family regulator